MLTLFLTMYEFITAKFYLVLNYFLLLILVPLIYASEKSANSIHSVCEENTGKQHSSIGSNIFIFILRSDVSISDCSHCHSSPIKWDQILITNRFLSQFIVGKPGLLIIRKMGYPMPNTSYEMDHIKCWK